jgi:LL-diaminopimelate aminotransferase
LDPLEEILPSMGSKGALTYAALAFLNAGDVLLTTSPAYAVLPTFASYLGAEIFAMPLLADENFFPNLATIPPDVLQRAKMLHLNYPNNPTGACASEKFFAEAVTFCRRHSLLLLHDGAYAGLWDELCPPSSILQISGAKDIALELHSCSKAHNLTGWRMGWACGGRRLLAALRRIKENCDSGQFLPIQWGAMAALDDDAFCHRSMALLRGRMEVVEKIFSARGFTFPPQHHPFYCYAPAPRAGADRKFSSAMEFCEWLLETCGILTVPWDETSPHLRLSMTIPMEIAQLEELLLKRLSGLHFSF